MMRGVVVIDHADTRCGPRWFVGVTTPPMRRAAQVGRSVRPVVAGRPATMGLVGNFVTAHGESWSPATRTGPSRPPV